MRNTPLCRGSPSHPPLVQSAEDVARVPLTLSNATVPSGSSALTIGDVAKVVEDHGPPISEGLVTAGRGLLLIVEKHPEGNTLELTRKIDAALATLKPAMPGIEVDATIFRPAGFIERALRNLGEAMGLGCALGSRCCFCFSGISGRRS